MRNLLIFWFAFQSTSVLADVARWPEFYFWKPSFVQIQEPTIIGEWISRNTTYSFRADGTGEIFNGKNSTSSFRWKQRDDGKIYINGSWRTKKGSEKSEFRYAGYTKWGAFVRDELDYEDKYSKVLKKTRSRTIRAS